MTTVATEHPTIDPLEHLGLVGMVAKRHLGRGLDLDDLMSEGFIGVLRAIGTFRPEYECAFGTHAVPWIQTRMRRAIAKWNRPGSSPAYGCTGDDGDHLMANAVDVNDESDRHEHHRMCELLAALDRLPGREAEVIRRRFGLGCEAEAQAAIGRSLGVSRERAREIEDRGLRRLRERFGIGRRAAS